MNAEGSEKYRSLCACRSENAKLRIRISELERELEAKNNPAPHALPKKEHTPQ